MAVQRLILESLDDDYELIAIHCSLASYKLAFVLNKHLRLQLFRTKEDINFRYDDGIGTFPLYQYEDDFRYHTYSLLGNKFKTKQKSNAILSEGLFSNTTDVYDVKYLIPELKKVDYFLKIETESLHFSCIPLLNTLQTIPQVITAHTVTHTQLKSKNNLILE